MPKYRKKNPLNKRFKGYSKSTIVDCKLIGFRNKTYLYPSFRHPQNDKSTIVNIWSTFQNTTTCTIYNRTYATGFLPRRGYRRERAAPKSSRGRHRGCFHPGSFSLVLCFFFFFFLAFLAFFSCSYVSVLLTRGLCALMALP